MIFRDFVEQTKDAIHTLVTQLEHERCVTPMLHLESDDMVEIVAVDPRFFASTDDRRRLIDGFVIPLLRQRQAHKVAWTFSADIHQLYRDDTREHFDAVVATFIDPERHETWLARIHRPPAGVPFVGVWAAAPPNQTEGPLLIQPVQEAMR